MRKNWRLLGTLLSSGLIASCGEPGIGQESSAIRARDGVGLSLFIRNGASAPLAVIQGFERYPQEIDITASVTTSADEGIAPVTRSGDMAGLDWTGVSMVEETWTPSLDGTFTRVRFYRNARWMERQSHLIISQLDARGRLVAAPWVVNAGRDDRLNQGESMFVRRFDARQIATGCPSQGNCTGASYTAEGLAQLRYAQNADNAARRIAPNTTRIGVRWSADNVERFVAISQLAPSAAAQGAGGVPLTYGFQVEATPVAPPPNGTHYLPGSQVSFRVTFRDGAGNALYAPGGLPPYGAFFGAGLPTGLRYLDLTIQTALYYALKHRESNLLAVLSGPLDRLRTAQTVVNPLEFFGPQVNFATTAVDGYAAVGQTVPPAGIVFGGFQNPALWSVPVSDVLTFSIPADAQPGTYMMAIKARREFNGEALNRGATVRIQVGSPAVTSHTSQTRCVSCHAQQDRSFGQILHGISDRASCFGCHSSLGIEFDNALDIRVHTIHDRSDRFQGSMTRCTTCHTTQPSAPARGLLP